uniref:hypothetical protein n=1 Tax=Moorena producens TaxID=1155739 RepID=UPI0005C7F1A7
MSERAETDLAAERAADTKNLKSVGLIHLVALMAAITLWGAADTWSTTTGWSLAWIVAIVNAGLAAHVIANIGHEWGHYLGARLAGSKTQAFDKPIGYFFMFNFPFDQNDRRQFLWMSWGGILAPWVLVALTLVCIPVDTASRALLLAMFVTRAMQVALFEVPVARRTARGGDP